MKYLMFVVVTFSLVGCSSGPSANTKDAFLNTLDKRKIRNAIRIHQSDVQHCVDTATDKPDPNGKIAMKWTVGPTGNTSGATVTESTVGSKQAEDCAVNAVKTWNFPPAPNSKPYVVGFPFVSTKDAGGSAPAAAESNAAAAAPAATEPMSAELPADATPQ